MEMAMPLIKSSSDKALGKNIKEEMKSKPKKQAVAIGLSVQREAAKGKRRKSLEDAYAKYIKKEA